MVSDDRAQLLLIGGVLIALAVIASVVLLNSIYAPGDLRTANIESDTEDLTHLHDELEHALEGLFLRTDERDGAGMPFITSRTEFAQNVSEKLLPAYANSLSDDVSGVLTVAFTGGETGWAVYQQNGTTFVGPAGTPSWRVAEGVDALVRVQMTIEEVDEAALSAGEAASLTVNDSASAWRLNVTEDDVRVVSGGTATAPLCDVTVDDYDRIAVRIAEDAGHVTLVNTSTGKTVRCRDFDVARTVGTDFDVRIVNGDALVGDYAITGQGGTPDSAASGYPNKEESVIVNPRFEVRFVSSGVTYTSEFALYDRTQS